MSTPPGSSLARVSPRDIALSLLSPPSGSINTSRRPEGRSLVPVPREGRELGRKKDRWIYFSSASRASR